MAIDNSGYYLTFEAFLLSLVMVEHKEIQHLRRLLDDSDWTY
jgi:hypothetical protein